MLREALDPQHHDCFDKLLDAITRKAVSSQGSEMQQISNSSSKTKKVEDPPKTIIETLPQVEEEDMQIEELVSFCGQEEKRLPNQGSSSATQKTVLSQ